MWGRLSSLPFEATFQSPRRSRYDACQSQSCGLESPLNWQARKPAPHARPHFFHSSRDWAVILLSHLTPRTTAVLGSR